MGDKFYVCFSIPEVYYEWFKLYNRLRERYVIVCCMNSPIYKPFAYISFETLAEAIEFRMVEL